MAWICSSRQVEESRNNVVCATTTLRAERPRNRGSVPGVKTGADIHEASYWTGNGCHFLRETEAGTSTQSLNLFYWQGSERVDLNLQFPRQFTAYLL